MTESLSVAEAKRRFSELIDRVARGEEFIVARRGKPAMALVAADRAVPGPRREAPAGLAAVAGALADWDDLDTVVDEIYANRRVAADRPAPDLD